VEALLAQARQDDPLTKHLQRLVEKLPTIPQPKPSRLTHWWRTLRTTYRDRWQRRNTNGLVRGFFLGEVLLFVLGGFFSLFANISGGAVNIDNHVRSISVAAIGQLVTSVIAAGYVAWGLVLWKKSRLAAYEQFRRATLVNILLTQFFAFARLQFLALPGFFFNIALLGFIGYAIRLNRTAKP
jgi:hypothetical protein